MGVPKSKITRSKRGLRRAHDGIISGQYGECSNCGELKLSHHVCQSCGYYNKKLIIRSKDADSDEDSDSKKSKFFFKYKFSLGFILSKFKSKVEIPPIQSSKTAKDCWSPPLESCFFFQIKNSSTEILSI